MEKWLGIAAVALIAAGILLLADIRRARVTRRCDEFARAFVRLFDSAADILKGGKLACASDNSGFALLPIKEQPGDIQALLECGLGTDAEQALADMRTAYDEAKKELTVINLVSKRCVPVLDRCMELALVFARTLEDPSFVSNEKIADAFNYFISEQKYLRTVTLPAITGEAAAREISSTAV